MLYKNIIKVLFLLLPLIHRVEASYPPEGYAAYNKSLNQSTQSAVRPSYQTSAIDKEAADLKKEISSARSFNDDEWMSFYEKYRSFLEYAKKNPEFVKNKNLETEIAYIEHSINTIESKKQGIKSLKDKVIRDSESKSGNDLHKYLNEQDPVLDIKNYQIVLDYAQQNPDWKKSHEDILKQANIEKIIAEIPTAWFRGAAESLDEYCKLHYKVILDYAQKYPDWVNKESRNSVALSKSKDIEKRNKDILSSKPDSELFKMAYDNPSSILKEAEFNHKWARANEALVEYAVHRDKVLTDAKKAYINTKDQAMELTFGPKAMLDKYYSSASPDFVNQSVLPGIDDRSYLQVIQGNIKDNIARTRKSLQYKLRDEEMINSDEAKREAQDKKYFGIEHRV